MKYWFTYILRYFIFWVVFFEFARLVFWISQSVEGIRTPNIEEMQAFLYGLRMDISLAAYITTPVLLLLLINHGFRSNKIFSFIDVYSLILGSVLVIIFSVDCELYQDWGFRMDYTPFLYLKQANEAKNFLTTKMIVVFTLAMAALLIGAIYLYRKITIKAQIEKGWKIVLLNILLVLFMIIPIGAEYIRFL